MTADNTLTIDIVSDVVCPWCIIGYKQLEQALAATGVEAELRWHPFQLNPDMPAEGQNHIEYLSRKYGRTREQVLETRAHLTALGKELGFPFNYTDDMRTSNTFNAHQLLHWAGEQGRQTDLKLALFESFFTNREDLGDPDVLGSAAERAGLEAAEARAVVEDQRYADTVRREQRVWTERGIQGVPAMIFKEKYLLSGAQGVDRYKDALIQLTSDKAA